MFKPLLLINNNITIHKTGDTNVVRKILCLQENSRTYFLESPAFLPGESGIFSWRVRHFFLESPVSFPGESGVSSWRVRYLSLESAGQSITLIHRSAWNKNSANFALSEFSEVQHSPVPLPGALATSVGCSLRSANIGL